MSLLKMLQTLETEISEYAEVADKDIDVIVEEIKDFVVGKKVEHVNAQAAATGEKEVGQAVS